MKYWKFMQYKDSNISVNILLIFSLFAQKKLDTNINYYYYIIFSFFY